MKEGVHVRREIYVPYSEERGGAVVSVRYLGNGLRREERLSYERYDDWQEGHQIRTSEDNGDTWTEWRMLHEQWPRQRGLDKEEGPFAWCRDPVSPSSLHRLLPGSFAAAAPDVCSASSISRRTPPWVTVPGTRSIWSRLMRPYRLSARTAS